MKFEMSYNGGKYKVKNYDLKINSSFSDPEKALYSANVPDNFNLSNLLRTLKIFPDLIITMNPTDEKCQLTIDKWEVNDLNYEQAIRFCQDMLTCRNIKLGGKNGIYFIEIANNLFAAEDLETMRKIIPIPLTNKIFDILEDSQIIGTWVQIVVENSKFFGSISGYLICISNDIDMCLEYILSQLKLRKNL